MEKQSHWKMYKAGKKWVFAAATVISIAAGATTVHADTATGSQNTVTTQQASTVDQSGETASTADSQSVPATSGASDQSNAPATDDNQSIDSANNQRNTDNTQAVETKTDTAVTNTENSSSTANQINESTNVQPTAQPSESTPNKTVVSTPEQSKQAETVTSQDNSANHSQPQAATQSLSTDKVVKDTDSSAKNEATESQNDQTTNKQQKAKVAMFSAKALQSNQDINAWMPDKNMQKQVLSQLISAGILNWDATANDITEENVKQLQSLKLGSSMEADYIDPNTSQTAKAPEVYTADPDLEVGDLSGLGYFTGLKDLTLTDNTFTEVPDEISNLKGLESLVITRNINLNRIGDLSGLSNLKTLKISYNPELTVLPASINTLVTLQGNLDLHGNSFTSLPDMSALQSITGLDLNNNRLTTIEGANLGKLVNLESLNLGSYDGTNYATWINGLGGSLNTGNNPTPYDAFDKVPNRESNVHLNYDPTTQVPNMTLFNQQTGKYYYAFSNVFTRKDLEHYNHLTSLPDELANLINLKSLNLIGNDLKDLPENFSNLKSLTDLKLGNNNFVVIPDAIKKLVKNANFSVNFNNYLNNYPSFGTYRNQNSITQNQIWDQAGNKFVIDGWNPEKDQALSQVIKYPDHYVVTYNSKQYTLLPGYKNPLNGEYVNDSQAILLSNYYYTGPGHLSTGNDDPDGIIIQQFVHYPSNWPNGTDKDGKYTAPNKTSWNYGQGYYGGMYGATNDIMTVGKATTYGPDGKPLNPYPYRDPYGVVINGVYQDKQTFVRGTARDGNYYYVINLPKNWDPKDSSNINKTYTLNFSVGGRYGQNAPDGGASNGTGANGGFVNPDATGYSMVASTDVTFLEDGAVSINGKTSDVYQGHDWDPKDGFAGAVINDTNQTKISDYYGPDGKPQQGLGVNIQEVTPDSQGYAQVVKTYKDAADFNKDASTYEYTDSTHTQFAVDNNGNLIKRYFMVRYQYADMISNPVLINVHDASTLTGQDATLRVDQTWSLTGNEQDLASSRVVAIDTDGSKILNDTDSTNNKNQVTFKIVDNQNPNIVFTNAADFNAGKKQGHTYKLTVTTYDKRSEKGLTGLQFFTNLIQKTITVTDRIAGQSVVIKYVDDQGDAVTPPDGAPIEATYPTGKYAGDSFTVNQTDIPGYTFKEAIPDNVEVTKNGKTYTGTLKDTAGSVTFVYYKNAGKVTAKYVDENNQEIIPDGNATYPDGQYVGKTFTVGQADIPGYTFKEVATGSIETTKNGKTYTGTLKDTNNGSVTFVYYKNASAVNVKYVDENNQDISPAGSATYPDGQYVGKTFNADQLDIPGYTFKEAIPDNVEVTKNGKTYTGTLKDTAGSVTFVYYKNAGKVTAKYVDENNQEIISDGNATYPDGQYVGKTFTVDQADIPGYTFKEIATGSIETTKSGNTYTGTLKDTTNGVVKFVYYKNAGAVNVKYVDENNQEINPGGAPTSATYPDGQYAGKTFTVDQTDIPGYTFKEVAPGGIETTKNGKTYTGTLKDGTGAITFVYYQNAGAINVKYVDENNQEISPVGSPTYPNGQYVGHDYTTQPKAIDNYTFDKLAPDSLPQTGKLTKGGGTVTFMYKKNAVPTPPTPPTPVTPTPTPEPNVPNTPTPTPEPENPNVAKQTKFPKYVYARKAIRVHKNATFKKGEGTFYQKKPRIYSPVFKVLGVDYSKNGIKRYKVNGGYITANYDFVRPVYYTTTQSRIEVISPKGVYLHESPKFTQAGRKKVKFLKQGTVVKNIVKVVPHGKHLTRFYLKDGSYITTNKLFVSTVAPYIPYKVYNIKAINKYKTVNLKGKVQHYKNMPRTKRTVFTVNLWDYSRMNSRTMTGVKRYKVKGGYITANFKFVRPLYYLGSHKSVSVISKKGIYLHPAKKFADKKKNLHLRKGTKVKIKGIEKHGRITRFVTTNGYYITSNKKFVKAND
ncbi:MucBP domain-containing protein [Lentilactobacillus sp. Marseille-Q4993]|uniref:MucBP domain-containing protein n=1 Tax=Lentilactobacillus sp. Marseille-Q4993 TaxID=3039492 RepID=UPI0024BD44B9|nr:MucBP domain-containing protein [Lentilactobacillus sp. Marseille-Q4993]